MIGRRGFITGLAALVAAPAVIRVAELMPISTRFTPLYVPIDWLAMKYGMMPRPLTINAALRAEFREHGWSKPMADNWVDLNDHDPEYVRMWECESDKNWFRGYT